MAPSGLDELQSIEDGVVIPLRYLNFERTNVYDGENMRYRLTSGISFSAPLVSGVAALMLSVNPDLTQREVREIIVNTAIDQNNQFRFGAGLLNAHAAVRAAINKRADSTAVACADTMGACSFVNFHQSATSGRLNFDGQNNLDIADFTADANSPNRLSVDNANVKLTLPNPYTVTANTILEVTIQNDGGCGEYMAFLFSDAQQDDKFFCLPDSNALSRQFSLRNYNGEIEAVRFMSDNGANAGKTVFSNFRIYENGRCGVPMLIMRSANAY